MSPLAFYEPPFDDDLRLTAVHEAGHAIAATALVGRNPCPVTIVPDDLFLGRARAGTLVLPGLRYPVAVAEAEVQVLLAGLAAEEAIGGEFDAYGMALDEPRDEFHDIEKAAAWLAAAGITKERRERRLAALYGRALRLMARADIRAAMAVLVERLLEVRVVDADDPVIEKVHQFVGRLSRRRLLATVKLYQRGQLALRSPSTTVLALSPPKATKEIT